MSQFELLKLVASVLDRLSVPYMVTGSMASSAQGQPRSTHDVDLVVALLPSTGRKLAEEFPSTEYYLDPQAVAEAIQTGGMFNLLHLETGDKVDFWMVTDDEFDRSRFARRRRQPLAGMVLWMSSPEDTILMKLRWAQMSGGSAKQLTDALRVLEVQAPKLDRAYVREWVKRLQLQSDWEQLLENTTGLHPEWFT